MLRAVLIGAVLAVFPFGCSALAVEGAVSVRSPPHLPSCTIACLAKGTDQGDDTAHRRLVEQIPGLVRMTRPNTIPMGMGLVGLGAHGARSTMMPAVNIPARLALGMMLTVIVTSGSMLINDYHDHKLGVDNEKTKPGRPLVTGEVAPDAVKFVLKWGYALHLTLLCLVDTASMRLWVLANTLLTCAEPCAPRIA